MIYSPLDREERIRLEALNIASRDNSSTANTAHVLKTADEYAKFIKEGKTSE